LLALVDAFYFGHLLGIFGGGEDSIEKRLLFYFGRSGWLVLRDNFKFF
jgi:hypothetical protein